VLGAWTLGLVFRSTGVEYGTAARLPSSAGPADRSAQRPGWSAWDHPGRCRCYCDGSGVSGSGADAFPMETGSATTVLQVVREAVAPERVT
jgi:hypothetical protein